jgi:hypothetical protein
MADNICIDSLQNKSLVWKILDLLCQGGVELGLHTFKDLCCTNHGSNLLSRTFRIRYRPSLHSGYTETLVAVRGES